MAMEIRITQKQTQHLVMTPQLQQAIQLLQLSAVELHEVVQKELQENPLLEETPDTPEAADDPTAGDPTPAPPEPLPGEVAIREERPTDELPFDLAAMLFDDHEERSLVATEDREDLPFENIGRSVSSLADHLNEQLRFAIDDLAARGIGTDIIGNLDEDGYLRASLEEIAGRRGVSVAEIEKVLAVVQGFDPPGVAARSAQECLLIQLQANPERDPLSLEIVEQHFDELTRRRDADIARALEEPLDRVLASIDEIARLEPKPGRRFGGSDPRYIVPDVTVHRIGDDYAVVLNEDGITIARRTVAKYREDLGIPHSHQRRLLPRKR